MMMAVKNNTSDRNLDFNMDYVQVIEKSDGTLVYRLRKRDSRGKEQSTRVIPPEGLSERATRKWLTEEVNRFVQEVDNGYRNSDSKMLFSQYFDEVFVRKRKLTVREKTLSDYIAMFNRHIRNDIGTLPIGKIAKVDLMEYYHDLDDKGLGNASILAIHRIISATLNSAVEDEIIPRNVAAGKNIAPRKKMAHGKTLNEYEIMRVIECLAKEPVMWQNIIMLMLHTGCRRGEIAGLRWEDVDLIRKTIHIRHSLVYVPQKGLNLEDAKSEMSNRDVPLFDDDVDALMIMYKDCHQGFVFRSETDPDQPLFPDSITKYVARFCKKYDLPHFSPHTLRRTMPTIMITMFKADPKTMQTLLGHSNISTTLGYYTMVSDEDRRNAIEKYGRYAHDLKEKEDTECRVRKEYRHFENTHIEVRE